MNFAVPIAIARGQSRCSSLYVPRREEYLGRGARGLGEAACRCARSPWRGGKTGDHSRSFYEVGTRRSKGIGMSHARANVSAVGILDLQAGEDVKQRTYARTNFISGRPDRLHAYWRRQVPC